MSGSNVIARKATSRWPVLGAVAASAALLAAGLLYEVRHNALGLRSRLAAAAGAIGLMSQGVFAESGALPPPPPTQISINASPLSYTTPFQNLIMGTGWLNSKWQPLGETYQDRNGDIVELPADGIAYRFLNIPGTGSGGIDVRCTWTGSGNVIAQGFPKPSGSGGPGVNFRVSNNRSTQTPVWLKITAVDPARPMRDLDCRDAGVPRSARFRAQSVDTLRGFAIVRFMDWQNMNANLPVSWATRHTPASNRVDADGVAIEDMMALSSQIGATPWFTIPWNADDDYIAHFAAYVAANLPANRQVYVEVANEVWNHGFAVAKQAIAEGTAKGLATNPAQAGLLRHAERTVEVMKIWERAFAGRKGLVRIIALQHVVPERARAVLAFGDTALHVDALATAPYFGPAIGGPGPGVDAMFTRLPNDLATVMSQAMGARRVAQAFGKRYVTYEGGQGVVLYSDQAQNRLIQSDSRMYDLYKSFIAQWQAQIGDVLCLYSRAMPVRSNGAWGLSEYEEQGPATAPKLHAVKEAMAGSGPVRTP